MQKNKYFIQLDALRAIAVLMVLLYHWLPSVDFLHNYQIGPYGVSVFFVLSGFLITRILMIEKEKIAQRKTTFSLVLKAFYIKRALRIFPIFYLLVLFLFLVNFETVRMEAVWHFSYLSNVLYVVNEKYSNGVAHFWSLAVEEQFYLIWPFLILLIPKTRLLYFLLFTIILGVFSFIFLALNVPNGTLLMPARIDAFALGGLLSYLTLTNSDWAIKLKKYNWLLLVSLFTFVVLQVQDLGRINLLSNIFFYIICLFLIGKMVLGFDGIGKRIFENSIVVYIGKISYGIYLYHNLMQWLVPYYSEQLNLPFPGPHQEFARFVIYFILTIIVSSLSYYLIEQNFNKLKTKYKT